MNKNELQERLMSVIVEYMVDEIIKKYAQRCKTALVLYSGALLGFQDAIESLKTLKADGWKLTVAMSKSAEEIITKERIQEEIAPEAIVTEGSPADYRKLVDENNFVLIPSLSINTTAKVVNCISDNLLTRIISRSMIVGKPIIASIDGCCPDNEQRASMGFRVTEAYKVKLRSNLEELRSFGVVLTSSRNLANKANKIFSSKYSFSNDHMTGTKSAPKQQVKKTASKAESQPQGQAVKLDQNIISKRDIVINQRYQTIIVRKNATVTALARDEAYKRKITIVTE